MRLQGLDQTLAHSSHHLEQLGHRLVELEHDVLLANGLDYDLLTSDLLLSRLRRVCELLVLQNNMPY